MNTHLPMASLSHFHQISAVAADCDKHSDDIECAVLAGDILFTGSDDGHIKVIIAEKKLSLA